MASDIARKIYLHVPSIKNAICSYLNQNLLNFCEIAPKLPKKIFLQQFIKLFDIFNIAAELRFNLRLFMSVLSEVLLANTLAIIHKATIGYGG